MKKLKFVLLFCLILFIQNALLAQDYVVSLKGAKINIPDNPYQVVDVIDARIDKSSIGYGELLVNEKKTNVPLQIEPKSWESLLALFKTNSSESSDKKPIIIKINKLVIKSHGGKNGLDYVLEINLDFYSKDDNGYYHEFTAGSYIKFSGLNKKQKNEAIELAVRNSYKEFLHRMKNNWGYHLKIDENELNTNSLSDESKITTKYKNFKNGIYYSFNGFRDNLADTVTPFELEQIGGDGGLGYGKFKSEITHSGSVEVNEIWGVQHNGKLYIQVAGYFIPVVATKDGYIIKNMTTFERYNYARTGFKIGYNVVFIPTAVIGLVTLGPTGIFFPSALFGLVGGGIGAGIGAISPRIDISDDEYKIDMATGMPIPTIKQRQNREIEFVNNFIIYTQSTGGKKLELLINGKKVCDFKPNSYLSMPFNKEISIVNICIKSDFDNCCRNLAIEGNEKTYFEAVLLEDGKVELIQIERAKLKSTIDYAIGNRIFEKVDAETHEQSVLDNDNKLDMTTGIPAPLNEADFTMNEAELIFFTDKTNDQNFELFINGKKECSFMPNSYYSLRLTSQAIPINVCLKSDSDEYCEAISVDIFNTRYFEVIINKKGKVSLFEKKSASMHSSINYLIEKGKMVKIEEETK